MSRSLATVLSRKAPCEGSSLHVESMARRGFSFVTGRTLKMRDLIFLPEARYAAKRLSPLVYGLE